MQRKGIHLVDRDPPQLIALTIRDNSLEWLERLRDNRRVRPESEVENRGVKDSKGAARNIGLFGGFAQSARLGRFALFAGSPGDAPSTAEMTPGDAMLHENAHLGIPYEQPGRTEAAPESCTVRTFHPRITGIALPDRRERRWKRHHFSLPCFHNNLVQRSFPQIGTDFRMSLLALAKLHYV